MRCRLVRKTGFLSYLRRLGSALPGACTYKGGSGRVLNAGIRFFFQHSQRFRSDGAALMKAQALQRMERTKDSMVRYNYLAVALKTCLATSDC